MAQEKTRSLRRLLAVVTVLVLFSAACSTTGTKTAVPESPGTLEWSDCDDLFQCTSLAVPVDYAEPDGDTVELQLIRRQATEPSERLGSLVINFGGPGGSGIDILRGSIGNFRNLGQRFDIVSFDPRGVGSSEPIDCLSDSELDDFLALDANPDNQSEFDEMLASYDFFAASCEENGGELLLHVSTDEVAQDLDLIREALGDEQLSYLGYSYGTSIGAAYLEQFPENARALLLDGAVHPSLTLVEQLVEQTEGFEQAFTAFIDDCDSRDCAIGPDSRAAIEQLFAEVEVAPIPASGERDLGPALLEYGIVAALYSQQTWDFLAGALDEAMNNNPDRIILLADFYSNRNDDGTFDGNLMEGLYAVDCLDQPAPDFDEVAAAAAIYEDNVPLGASNIWSALACQNWPRENNPVVDELSISTDVPALVLGTTGDPATPVEWAREMYRQIPGAELLIFEGEGHTAYPGDDCVDQIVESFFVDPGTLQSAEC